MELNVKRPVWVEVNLDNLGHNMTASLDHPEH